MPEPCHHLHLAYSGSATLLVLPHRHLGHHLLREVEVRRPKAGTMWVFCGDSRTCTMKNLSVGLLLLRWHASEGCEYILLLWVPLNCSDRFWIATTHGLYRILQHWVILRLRWWNWRLMFRELLSHHILLRPQIHTWRAIAF